MTQQIATDQVTMNAKLIERLLALEYERGKQDGADSAKSLALDCSGYSSGKHAVGIITAKTRRELSRKVRDHAWQCSGDNPGQAYRGTCELLRALKGDSGHWQGICIFSTYYDI